MSKVLRPRAAACCVGLLFSAAVVSSPADAHDAGTGSQSHPDVRRVIFSMTGDAADDVWAVGSVYADYPTSFGLTEHWNGDRWRRIATPGGDSVQLYGVSEIASDDVWAVGTTGGGQQPIILHWDGSNWSVVPGAPEVRFGWFSAVDALATDDVWAVGFGNGAALVEHWDGNDWSVVRTPPLPGPGISSELGSVAFSSPTDGWTLGVICGSGQLCEPDLSLHWDGSRWHRVTMPHPDQFYYASITALSPTDAWAVGQDRRHGWRHRQPLAAHWDGMAWTSVSFPQANQGELESVVAVGSDDLWAFGDYRDAETGVVLPLVGHFDGSSWNLSDMSGGRANQTYLHGGVAIGAKDVWAGGRTGKGTFVRHWDGTGWS